MPDQPVWWRPTRQYEELVGRYESIPFASGIAFDVDQYAVDRALGGLFHLLGPGLG